MESRYKMTGNLNSNPNTGTRLSTRPPGRGNRVNLLSPALNGIAIWVTLVLCSTPEGWICRSLLRGVMLSESLVV